MTNCNFPLHYGIRCYDEEISIVKLLLKKNVNHINLVDSEGQTPLLLAAFNPKCHTELIELLLEEGANVKAKSTKEGNTALHYVAMSNSPRNGSAIDILLEHGSDVNAKNLNGDTPLHFVLQNQTITHNNYVHTSSFVRKCGNLNLANSQGETPLHLAAQNPNCYPEIIKLLLEHGADVNAATTRDGNTALHYVAMTNNISSHNVVKLLLKHGSAIDVGNLEGDTPLHLAARNGGVNVPLLELLEHAEDVNIKNHCRDTPLHLYLQNKTMMSNFVLMNKFVRKCSDINLPNCNGETLLHLVVKNESFYNNHLTPYCQISLIRIFLDYGVDCGKADATGETVYQAYCKASQKHNKRTDPMLDIILQPDKLQKEMSSSLHVACLFHKVDLIHKLLRFGTDINSTENFGYSPLFYALISHGNDDERLANKCATVKLLLDYCADMNHQFTRSSLSLSTLCFNGITDMDDKDYRTMRSIFLKHTAKLLTLRDNPADISINPEGMQQYNIYYYPSPEEIGPDNIQEFETWRTQCAEEVKWMSHVKIGENRVTFLELLFSSAKEVTTYAKNKNLVEAFHSKKSLFPMYQGMLDAKFASEIERRKLVESAAVAFSDSLKFADPRDEFFEKTLSYCSNKDLFHLIEGTSEIDDEVKEKLQWIYQIFADMKQR